MLSNGMRERRTTLIHETVPKASGLTQKATLVRDNTGKNKSVKLKAFQDAVASGGTSIIICGAPIPAGNSGGHSSTPLPSVPQGSCVIWWRGVLAAGARRVGTCVLACV